MCPSTVNSVSSPGTRFWSSALRPLVTRHTFGAVALIGSARVNVVYTRPAAVIFYCVRLRVSPPPQRDYFSTRFVPGVVSKVTGGKVSFGSEVAILSGINSATTLQFAGITLFFFCCVAHSHRCAGLADVLPPEAIVTGLEVHWSRQLRCARYHVAAPMPTVKRERKKNCLFAASKTNASRLEH